MKKWILRFSLVLVLALIAVLIFIVYPKLPIISGYAAKRACSCLYVGKRSLESIEIEELEACPKNLADLNVNPTKKTVTASTFGMAKMTSVYQAGLGCKLIIDEDDHKTSYLPKTKNSLEAGLIIGQDLRDSTIQIDKQIGVSKRIELEGLDESKSIKIIATRRRRPSSAHGVRKKKR